MRVVLHIGMAKTGTSTLQTTLGRQRPLLAEAGILYPATRWPGEDHNVLACLFKPLERIPRVFTSHGYDDLESLRRIGRDFWHEVESEATRHDPEIVLLSSELLFYMVDDEIRELDTLLRRLFDEIRVVAYVRDPTSYYLSAIQQRIKASHRITPPNQYRLPLKRLLERHLEVFGPRLEVRAFDREKLRDGCIVRDFLDVVLGERDQIVERIEVQNRNESMSAEAMCIVQQLRRLCWPDHDDVFMDGSDTVIRTLRAMGRREPQTSARLKPGIAARIRQRHAADVEWLRTRFGVSFRRDAAVASAGAADGCEGWTSHDLRDIVEVEPESVDRTLFSLVRELSDQVARGKESSAEHHEVT